MSTEEHHLSSVWRSTEAPFSSDQRRGKINTSIICDFGRSNMSETCKPNDFRIKAVRNEGDVICFTVRVNCEAISAIWETGEVVSTVVMPAEILEMILMMMISKKMEIDRQPKTHSELEK